LLNISHTDAFAIDIVKKIIFKNAKISVDNGGAKWYIITIENTTPHRKDLNK
jgi:hypothetical protein